MWQRSATFRRQCRRLEAERHVRVRVLSDDRHGRGPFFDARSFLHHEGGRLASASIHVSRSSEAVEHIAHELEHVMEQLDSVDLQAQTVSGAAWKRGDGSFETRRAIVIGQRVAREVASGTASGHAAPAPGKGGELVTVQQRDRSRSSGSRPSARVSADGRYVVFTSLVQLVATDRNQHADIYVLDLVTGQLTLESVGHGSGSANGWSANPDISGDGRYVVFESVADNLTNGTFPPGVSHVFLRDRVQGTTHMLTMNHDGEPASGPSRNAAISADGSAVVFESAATDLLHGDEAGHGSTGIYVRRLASGQLDRVDTSADGESAGRQSMSPSISADGRFVAFASRTGVVCAGPSRCDAGRAARTTSIHVRDLQTKVTARVSTGASGRSPNGPSYHPSISANGRYVAFVSEASNLNRRPAGWTAQVYVHDRVTGTTELVSRRPDGRPADGPSRLPAISGDGSLVAFQSLASNLVCMKQCADDERDINLVSDVFVFDRASGKMTRESRDASGVEWMAPSRGPSLDHSGRVLTFSSRHPIDDADVDHDDDLFIRTRR
jgi:Tol biopolymer transport system component